MWGETEILDTCNQSAFPGPGQAGGKAVGVRQSKCLTESERLDLRSIPRGQTPVGQSMRTRFFVMCLTLTSITVIWLRRVILHVLTGDPHFADPGQCGIGRRTLSGYRFRAGSPARGSGRSVEKNGAQDFWGNPAPSCAGTDRGASQSQDCSVEAR